MSYCPPKAALFAALLSPLFLLTAPAGAAPADTEEALKEMGITLFGSAERGYNVRSRNNTSAEAIELIGQLPNVTAMEIKGAPMEGLEPLLNHTDTAERFKFHSDELDDRIFPILAQFTNATALGARTDTKEPPITAEGFAQLGEMPGVTDLHFGGHDIPPEILSLLPTAFPNATKVDFNHTFRVNADVFEAFKQFNSLEELNLGGCYKTDEAGMRAIGGLKDLKSLSVFHAGNFQWATLAELEGHPNLESLYVGDGRKEGSDDRVITNEDLRVLLTIPTLERFKTGADGGDGLTDAAGEILARHPNIKSLNLGRPAFTGAILEPLAAAPSLEELEIEFTNYTDEQIALLATYPMLKKVRLGAFREGAPVDDFTLKALKGIENLTELDVRLGENSGVSKDAIDDLKATYPDAKVEVRYGLEFKEKDKLLE